MPQHRPASAAPAHQATITPALAESMAAAGLEPGRSPAPVRLPDAGALFQRRADRLRRLMPGHRLSGWLAFIAQVSDAQHALAAIPVTGATDPAVRWRQDLDGLRERLSGRLPDMAERALAALPWGDADALSAAADRLRTGTLREEEIGGAPFLVAALQVAWTRMASGLTAGAVAASAVADHCPVCGSEPVAGVIHAGSEASGRRYLHCGLCHTAWHHVRSACVCCGEGNRIDLQRVEGAAETGSDAGGGTSNAAQAETCESCHSYLKLFVEEKAPGLDPVADDLASFALDILVSDAGFQRIGGNPFLAQAG